MASGTALDDVEVHPADRMTADRADQFGQLGPGDRRRRVVAHFGFGDRRAVDQMDVVDRGPSDFRKGRGDQADLEAHGLDHAVDLGPHIAAHAGIDLLEHPFRAEPFQLRRGLDDPRAGGIGRQRAGIGLRRQHLGQGVEIVRIQPISRDQQRFREQRLELDPGIRRPGDIVGENSDLEHQKALTGNMSAAWVSTVTRALGPWRRKASSSAHSIDGAWVCFSFSLSASGMPGE